QYNQKLSNQRMKPGGASRDQLLKTIFPGGVPTLWCPSLTHYSDHGELDRPRTAAHLRHLAAHVKGFLIPGSTGDGWELDEREFRELLDLALEQALSLELHVLIGVLKPDAAEALNTIRSTVEWIKSRAKE